MKYFRMSYEEILYKRSFINIMLLNASIPSLGDDDDKKDTDEEREISKNAFVPRHANDIFDQLL